MKRVLVIDTSVLCVWLAVPRMDTCGPEQDQWDKSRIDQTIKAEEQDKTLFVLPIATIIETGNHIAQAPYQRKELAEALAQLITRSASGLHPWAAFTDQKELWAPDKLKALAGCWPELAAQKLSLGDATIKEVADFYAGIGCEVEIFTGDLGLKAYEPMASTRPQPRRRSRRK